MRVVLHVSQPMRSWHRMLMDRLERAGHHVSIVQAANAKRPSSKGAISLAIERHLFRRTTRHFVPIGPVALSIPPEHVDLHVVLAGAVPLPHRWIQPLFAGIAGEDILVDYLLRGQVPIITICDDKGRSLVSGLPAVEDPFVLSHALDSVLDRLITLIAKAVETTDASSMASVPEAAAKSTVPASTMPFMTRVVKHRLKRRFGSARGRPDHWRIAFRQQAATTTTLSSRAWPSGPFTVLKDDGQRFYADPFIFEHNGIRYLFFEDFPYDTAKGVISVVTIDADGSTSRPCIVLQQATHLSYPFVFREGEEIYMLPETSEARCIRLFRADLFPDRWIADQILVSDVVASDATLVRHAGRYWIFATITEPGGSTWDQLALFHAPVLTGPWTPHRLNPVLIDAGSARPAGAMWHEEGQLMRVAQDCRTGYGVGLAICRVDRLDPEGFSQTVIRRLGPPTGFNAVGVHTLNRSDDLEVIDLRVPHSR